MFSRRTWVNYRVVKICIAIVIVVKVYQMNPFSRYQGHDHVDIPVNGVVEQHTLISQILTSKIKNDEHGLMAVEVARLAKAIEAHIPGTDPEYMETAVTKLFPWWRADHARYYPWKRRALDVQPQMHPLDQRTGIVICVGNNNVYEAAHLVITLRKVHGSNLPIELAYAGDKDLTPYWRSFLLDLVGNEDIFPLDLTQVFDNDIVGFQNYDLKPFALLAGRYPQTILVDADALFFTAPDDIFDLHAGLRESGTLYYHDRSKYWTDNGDRRTWLSQQIAIAGRQPSAYLNKTSIVWTGKFVTEGADSAVVMVDKSRPSIYAAMLFAAWMNGKGPRDVTYKYVWGDKETYWIAGELTGIPYYFEPWTSARLAEGLTKNPEDAKANPSHPPQPIAKCTEHMAHADISGSAPLFVNDAVWRVKVDHGRGFANWTHWYLGKPLSEALSDAKDILDLPSDLYYGTKLPEATWKKYEEHVMMTQPSWDDSCKQRQPERWMPLSAQFRETMQMILAEAQSVWETYEEAKNAQT